MIKVIYGIDPDSSRHGIAVYRKNECSKWYLCELLNLNSIQLYKHLNEFEKLAVRAGELEIHMENPCGVSSSSFSHRRSDPPAVKYKKSEGVGRVKQAQVSVEQVAAELKIPVVHHRNSKCWKKGNDSKLFERITKWQGRSNEETRSAAFFGYLGTTKN